MTVALRVFALIAFIMFGSLVMSGVGPVSALFRSLISFIVLSVLYRIGIWLAFFIRGPQPDDEEQQEEEQDTEASSSAQAQQGQGQTQQRRRARSESAQGSRRQTAGASQQGGGTAEEEETVEQNT